MKVDRCLSADRTYIHFDIIMKVGLTLFWKLVGIYLQIEVMKVDRCLPTDKTYTNIDIVMQNGILIEA